MLPARRRDDTLLVAATVKSELHVVLVAMASEAKTNSKCDVR